MLSGLVGAPILLALAALATAALAGAAEVSEESERDIRQRAPRDMREWVQDVLSRGHGLLIARLRPALPGLGEQELTFRVFCVGGIVNRLLTAASLPESAAVMSPEFQPLLVAAVTGMLAGPANDVLS